MLSGRIHPLKLARLGLFVLISFTVTFSASGFNKEILEDFWHRNYGHITLPTETCGFSWELLAKAKVDECFYGLQDPRNRPSFNAVYPGDFSEDQIKECIVQSGEPKVNQAYVWGLAKSGDNVWFGTVANTLCLVYNGFYGSMTPEPVVNESYTCEMGFKDVRPPRIFMYNTKTDELKDMTPAVIARGGDDEARLRGTTGLRSAGSLNDVVFLGGIATGGVTLFAFNGETGDYIGSWQFPQYNNIRQWRVINKQLYTGVGKRGGGEVLRWTGSTNTGEFPFEIVGSLQGDPAYLVEHKGRIYASTWGGPSDAGGMFIAMSPSLGSDKKLTATDAGQWKMVWKLSQYEVEPAAGQVGGALESYGPWLYWGTMHVPGTGLVSYIQRYPDAPVDAAAFLGTYRPIVIFRGRDFDRPKQQKVELLYGTLHLPKYNKEAARWEIVPNRMHQFPKFGLAGINNFFNNYTWAMQRYHGKLFVGTMDWLYLGGTAIDISDNIRNFARNFSGADLHAFTSLDLPAMPVSLNGLGNYLNYGIRTILADDYLYLGTATPEPGDRRGESKGRLGTLQAAGRVNLIMGHWAPV